MKRRLVTACILSMIVAAVCVRCDGQAYRVRQVAVHPKPQLIVSGTVGITVTPTVVNFALVSGGVAQGSTTLTVTSAWSVVGVAPTFLLYGFFSSANGALTDGYVTPDLIPSSSVLGQMTTGLLTSFTPFNQTAPFGGTGAALTMINAFQLLPLIGGRTDTLSLEIDLTSVPGLPAGTYSGTLTLEAVMI